MINYHQEPTFTPCILKRIRPFVLFRGLKICSNTFIITLYSKRQKKPTLSILFVGSYFNICTISISVCFGNIFISSKYMVKTQTPRIRRKNAINSCTSFLYSAIKTFYVMQQKILTTRRINNRNNPV